VVCFFILSCFDFQIQRRPRNSEFGVALPFGPATFPVLSARAASMILFIAPEGRCERSG